MKIYRFLRRKKTGRFVLTSGFSFFLKKYAQPSAVRTFPFYRNKSKSQRRKTVRLNSLFFSKSKKFVPSQGFFCAEKFYCGAIFACAKKMRVKNSGNENYKNIICIGCFGGVRVRGVRPCAARLENKKCGHGQGNSRNGRAARKLRGKRQKLPRCVPSARLWRRLQNVDKNQAEPAQNRDGKPDDFRLGRRREKLVLGQPRRPEVEVRNICGKRACKICRRQFPHDKKPKGRAIAGLSMGGHGAMWLAIRHRDTFGAAG
ncbi:MAG: hypothetical protein IKO42_03945, partial [Opitutales bacterium]|nr:hypothetical protein [Opitutales bacterium]